MSDKPNKTDRIAATYDALIAAFRRLLIDVACPILGILLGYGLFDGRFETGAIPFVIPFAATLVGLPAWTRQDRKRRNGSDDDDDKAGWTIQIGRGGKRND